MELISISVLMLDFQEKLKGISEAERADLSL
jgi:hypothetical protein